MNVQVWYFFPSGKFFSGESFVWHGTRIVTVGRKPRAWSAEVVDHVRGLRDSGRRGALPGLPECIGWDGPILVTCEGELPQVLLPQK